MHACGGGSLAIRRGPPARPGGQGERPSAGQPGPAAPGAHRGASAAAADQRSDGPSATRPSSRGASHPEYEQYVRLGCCPMRRSLPAPGGERPVFGLEALSRSASPDVGRWEGCRTGDVQSVRSEPRLLISAVARVMMGSFMATAGLPGRSRGCRRLAGRSALWCRAALRPCVS